MFFGFIYNASTPDLYENNAHHKIGWIVSSVVVAQVIIGLIYVYSKPRDSSSAQYERASFLPVSSQNMRDHEESYPSGAVHQYRWSGDSGHGASRPTTPTTPDHEQERFVKPEDDLEEVDDRSEEQTPLARGFLRSKTLDRFFAKRIPGMVSSSVLRTLRIVYNVIDWIILPFGFIALTTGGVTYGGVFVCSHIPQLGWFELTGDALFVERKRHLQRLGSFYQGRHLLLVRPGCAGPLHGLLCQVWMGLEPEAGQVTRSNG